MSGNRAAMQHGLSDLSSTCRTIWLDPHFERRLMTVACLPAKWCCSDNGKQLDWRADSGLHMLFLMASAGIHAQGFRGPAIFNARGLGQRGPSQTAAVV